MEHRSDVGDGQEVDDVVLAGFDVDFDFGEAGDEGMRLAVVRILVARDAASGPGPPGASTDALVKLLMSRVDFVAVVDATQSAMAFCAACASVMPAPPPLRKTRSLATS